MKKLFVLSNACLSGTHCVNCRDKDGGAVFRQRVGAPDVCPPERGSKPWGWQPPPPPPPPAPPSPTGPGGSIFGPGNVMKFVFDKLGYVPKENCGCRAFQQKMNAWGLRGCLVHRKEILEWFTAKAREQGIEVDDARLWKLIRGGLKDLWRKWRTDSGSIE